MPYSRKNLPLVFGGCPHHGQKLRPPQDATSDSQTDLCFEPTEPEHTGSVSLAGTRSRGFRSQIGFQCIVLEAETEDGHNQQAQKQAATENSQTLLCQVCSDSSLMTSTDS